MPENNDEKPRDVRRMPKNANKTTWGALFEFQQRLQWPFQCNGIAQRFQNLSASMLCARFH
ncbi:hypothetical protein X777_01580 [Ooceraea biroi]|uniref:Uncharacterized protein n=1 Tax=Ooceraea biroi TaxID=2015173 RepID=A0A026WRB8_OOCBI|nr:hypothetical protein X777_01580 [Ooceraea biroi]